MPNIALNGRFSGTPQPTGTQTASYQLFDALVRAPREVGLVVFADSGFLEISEWAGVDGVRLIETPFRQWSRRRAQLWEQAEFPRLARRHGCRVAHHPMTTCPAWQNGLKNIVTLHDLNFFLHPEWYSLAFRLVYGICAVPGLRRAARVVTISNYVCQQAREVLKIRTDRLSMVYNGVKPPGQHLDGPSPAASNGTKQRAIGDAAHSGQGFSFSKTQGGADACPGLGDVARSGLNFVASPAASYLLCVGSLQPHKNLGRMIRAYQMVRADFPGLELRVVGRPQPRFANDPELPGLIDSPGVRLLGYLSEEELASQYSGAAAFCYPSLEEGFGLPILEAMGLGAPVLTSNLSCLPEVAGPSAVLVDPLSAPAIADGLREILRWTPAQKNEAVHSGREWAGRFSWKRAAGEYLNIYRQLLP